MTECPDKTIPDERPNFAYGDFERCPFCGNFQIYIFIDTERFKDEGVDGYYAACRRGDSCGVVKSTCRNIADAHSSWQRRVPND